MKVDPRKSRYAELPSAKTDFNDEELQHLRFLLRKLRFLEAKSNVGEGMADPRTGGGAVFAVMEMSALAFALTEIGYLRTRKTQ